MMQITKEELRTLKELAEFLDGHDYTKAADEVHIIVHKVTERVKKEKA